MKTYYIFNISDSRGIHQHRSSRYLQSNSGGLEAVKTLYKAGFQFVLLDNKKPIHCGYKNNPPDFKEVIYHKGSLGIVPDTASDYPLVALDVDYGNPKDLPLPFAKYPTKRGWHFYYYYPDSHAKQLGNFDAFNCQGQWIKSHCLLLHDGGRALHNAIKNGNNLKEFPLPINIYLKPKEKAKTVKKQKQINNLIKNLRLDLENMVEGDGRYNALFFQVGQFAKEQIRPETEAQFEAVLWRFAVGQNLRCKEPLDDEELNKIIRAKVDYCYPLSKVGWTKEQQRYGGLQNGKLRRAHNALRDEAIFNDHAKGFTALQLGKIYGLSIDRIRKIIIERRPKKTAGRPWKRGLMIINN